MSLGEGSDLKQIKIPAESTEQLVEVAVVSSKLFLTVASSERFFERHPFTQAF